jgi:hypothetical protein
MTNREKILRVLDQTFGFADIVSSKVKILEPANRTAHRSLELVAVAQSVGRGRHGRAASAKH